MTGSLLALYWNLNLLLAFSFVLWSALKALSRWPQLRLGGNAQLSWARRIFVCAVLVALCIEFAPRWLSLMPRAQTLKAGFIDEWTAITGVRADLPRQDALMDWQQWLLLVLVTGWVWQIGRLANQLHNLKRLVAQSATLKKMAKVHLLVSADIGVPFATKALGKCLVVLPEQLIARPAHWRLAAQHEFQHVRNGDLDWLLGLEVLKVLCFWNPLLHVWCREFEVLQELACDETLVVDRSVDPQAYGNCLLEVAQYQSFPALVGASAMVPLMRWFRNNNTLLRRRIMTLGKIQKGKNSRTKSAIYGLLIGVTLTSGSMLIAADAPPSTVPTGAPLVRINPDYPPQALFEGAEGWVQLEFSIDNDGRVSGAKVVESCAGPAREPCIRNVPMFAEVALTALERWRYASGNPRDGVQTILRFQLQDD